VKIDNDDLAFNLQEQVIHFAKWVIGIVHEDPALQIDDCILLAAPGLAFKHTHARHSLLVVGRTKHPAGPRVGITIG